MKRLFAAVAGLFVLFIPSFAFAVDCNGDGMDTATAGFDSASAAVTCAAEMSSAIFNELAPIIILFAAPCVATVIGRYAIRSLKAIRL